MSATKTTTGLSTDTFPYGVISPLCEDGAAPTFASLQLAQSQLNANAKSVYTSTSIGGHGHQVLVMQPARFIIITGNVVHPVPVHPGAMPALVIGMTQMQASIVKTVYEAELLTFNLYHDTDNLLRSQLIQAVSDEFIYDLHDDFNGYSNVTTLQLLTHLWTNYGVISRKEIEKNLERMNEPWHPTTSIELFFKQYQVASTFADNGLAPIGDSNLVMYAFRNLAKTGVFDSACREWELKPVADQTFTNFRTHFKQAYKLLPATTKSAGYHTANAAVGGNKVFTMADAEQLFDKKLAQLNKTRDTAHGKPGETATLTYCWTHGLSKNKMHDGHSCKNKADGHKEEATVNNKMGGSERVYTAADKRLKSD